MFCSTQAQKLANEPVVPARNFQLDDYIATFLVDGEDVDEPPARVELAGDAFFFVEAQARFDQARVPDEVIPQVTLEGELPRRLDTDLPSFPSRAVPLSAPANSCFSRSSL
jgi:hypothetical protein